MPPDIDTFLRTHAPIPTEGALPTGTRIHNWEITAFLARGAYGEVYCGKHLLLHRPLALKYATGDKAQRLAFEAQRLAELRHPMFPTVYGLEPYNDGLILAEELLTPYIFPTRDRPIAHLLLSLCNGLTHLHNHGWVHRDIKPANLMCRPDDQTPVLVDLGIAKRLTPYDDAIPSELSLLSDGKALHLGTPGYAAPEQFTGRAITTATDIHALGILIHHCFKGHLPHAWRPIVRRATTALPSLRYPDTHTLARAIKRRHLRTHILLALLAITLLALGITAHITLVPAPTPPAPQEIPIEEKTPMQINHEYFLEYLNRKPGDPPPPIPPRSKLLD